MGIDFDKLSPAPWTLSVETFRGYKDGEFGIFYFPTFEEAPFDAYCMDGGAESRAEEDAKFIALARNALDVMMKRHWYPVWNPNEKKWFVREARRLLPEESDYLWADDPFAALVDADKWYKENIEGK